MKTKWMALIAAFCVAAGVAVGLTAASARAAAPSIPTPLHAVNRAGSESACIRGSGFFDGPTDQGSINAMKSWGINAVRIPLNEDCWLNINGAPAAYSGTKYRNAIATYIKSLNASGIYVILDLHWSAPGTTKATGPNNMADKSHSITFWRGVATAYKGNNQVAFDLYNEPHGITWTQWLKGSSTWAGMNQLISAVRGTGALNPVIASGLAYGNDDSRWLSYKPTDSAKNLYAGAHVYNSSACNSASCWNTNYKPIIQAGNKFVFTAVGENDCASGFVTALFQWADANGVAGYAPWTWNASMSCAGGPSLVTDDETGTPTAYGQGVESYYQGSNPPTPTTTPPPSTTSVPPSTSSAPSTTTAPPSTSSAPSTTSVPPSSSSSAPPPHASTPLPLRGAFFYPWYPQSWPNPAPHYTPTLGAPYDQSDPAVVANQVAALNYGNFNLAISSWWGQGHYTDKRFQSYLNAAHGTPLEFAPYYEAEGNTTSATPGSPNPDPTQITSDLNYIASNYINDPNYLWVNNKPVIFVYADASDGCSMVDRWTQANAAATTQFYVVLKVFSGYASCLSQPDNWHQYAPASREQKHLPHSFVISPGYWKYTDANPLLPRDVSAFTTAVNDMNCSSADFKLVTTFNEWGEGTAVESANEWSSPSGYGQYLDVLHNDTTCQPTPPTSSAPPSTTSAPPSTTSAPSSATAAQRQ